MGVDEALEPHRLACTRRWRLVCIAAAGTTLVVSYAARSVYVDRDLPRPTKALRPPAPAVPNADGGRVLESSPRPFRRFPLPGFRLSQEQAETLLRKVATWTAGKRGFSNQVHALRLYHYGVEHRDPEVRRFYEWLLAYVTDDRVFRQLGGADSMILDSAYGVVYRTQVQRNPTAASVLNGGQSHVDKVLSVLAELEMPWEFPIVSRANGQYSLRELAQDSVARSHLERELEWSIVAYAQMMRAGASWQNHFQQRLDASDLVQKLLEQRPTEGPCSGCHRLYALAKVSTRAADDPAFISQRLTGEVGAFLETTSMTLCSTQLPDGSWDSRWPFPSTSGKADPQPVNAAVDYDDRLTVTAHMLEWFSIARPAQRPPEAVIRLAAAFVGDQLLEGTESCFSNQLGACTHAVRALLQLSLPEDP